VDNHEQWREAVSAYADGECDQAERAAVEAHLSECADCRQWLEQLQSDQEVFTETLMGRPADILDSVMKRVTEMSAKHEQPVARRKPMTVRRFVEAFAVVAVCAVLVSVLFPVFSRSKAKAPEALRPTAGLERKITKLEELPESAGEPLYRPSLLAERVAGPELRPKVDVVTSLPPPPAEPRAEPEALFAEARAKPTDRVVVTAGATTGIEPGGPEGLNFGARRPVQLAYDAAIEVWVKRLQEAVVTAEKTFYERGGFVLNSKMVQVETIRQPRVAEITGKVPKEEVSNTINDLAALGWVAQRELMGEDLTDAYTDTTRAITLTKEKLNKLDQERKKAGEAGHGAG